MGYSLTRNRFYPSLMDEPWKFWGKGPKGSMGRVLAVDGCVGRTSGVLRHQPDLFARQHATWGSRIPQCWNGLRRHGMWPIGGG